MAITMKRTNRLTIGSAVSSSAVSEVRDMIRVSKLRIRWPTNRLSGKNTTAIQMPHTQSRGWVVYATQSPSGLLAPRMGTHRPMIRHNAHATTVSLNAWRRVRTSSSSRSVSVFVASRLCTRLSTQPPTKYRTAASRMEPTVGTSFGTE